MPKKRVPTYALHKGSGQARVRINGKDVYLGVYGSPDSHQRFAEVLAEWARGNTSQVKDITIGQLTQLYTEHCKTYYRKAGAVTGEVNNIKAAIKYLNRLFRQTSCKDFDTLKLEAVRESMIDAGLARTTINNNIAKLKTMFKWTVGKKLIDKLVYVDLSTLPGLQAERSRARAPEPVLPVPEAFVNAVEDHVTSPVWAMIQLQILTGMRPGEVLQMRACDISTTGKVWEYRPQRHKTQHKRKSRVIAIGTKAQEILKPYLTTDLQAYLFDSSKGRAEYVEGNYCEDPVVAVRNGRTCYTIQGYQRAITRACQKADVPHWSPNRLRHNFATAVRKDHGLEAARLGTSYGICSL